MNSRITGRVGTSMPDAEGQLPPDVAVTRELLLNQWREVNALCQKWIDNALSVDKTCSKDLSDCKEAVKTMYRMAGIRPPRDQRIVFVSSPLAARLTAGFATAIWTKSSGGTVQIDGRSSSSSGKLNEEVCNAVLSIIPHRKLSDGDFSSGASASDFSTANEKDKFMGRTHYAIRAATYGVVYNSVYDAVSDEARDIIWDATRKRISHVIDPVLNMQEAALNTAISNTENKEKPTTDRCCTLDGDIAQIARMLGVGSVGLACVKLTSEVMHRGSSRAADDGYLDFFKSIAKIDINWSPIACCELLAKHTDWRFLHEHFCILSLKPVSLILNQPDDSKHNKEPFCQWADGSQLYGSIRLPDLPLLNVATTQALSNGRQQMSSVENMELPLLPNTGT